MKIMVILYGGIFINNILRCIENQTEHLISDAELLSVIIKSGTKDLTAIQLCQKVLRENPYGKNLSFLRNISIKELLEIDGIGPNRAVQFMAIGEIFKRMSLFGDEIFIKSSDDVAELLMQSMRYLKQEHLKVVMLTAKNRLIRHTTISKGTLDYSVISPREVFGEALRNGSHSIILVHNHPSGDPTPSNDDVSATVDMIKAGQIIGINFLDHIILGDGKYTSLKEQGYI